MNEECHYGMKIGQHFEMKVEEVQNGMFQYSIKPLEGKNGIPVGNIVVNNIGWFGLEQMNVSGLDAGKKYRLIAIEEAGL